MPHIHPDEGFAQYAEKFQDNRAKKADFFTRSGSNYILLYITAGLQVELNHHELEIGWVFLSNSHVKIQVSTFWGGK